MKKLLLVIASLAIGSIGLAGCSSPAADNPLETTPEIVETYDWGSVNIVDVRTPGEFAEGHLDGAVNIDVSDPSFVEKILEVKENEKDILIYCRSGNRSAQAAEILRDNEFTDIFDGGAIEEASEITGLEIVR